MQSIHGIMNVLQAAADCRRDIDEMISSINNRLPQLFIIDNQDEYSLNETGQQMLQV